MKTTQCDPVTAPLLWLCGVLMAIVAMVPGCTDTDNLFEECVRDDECAADEICLFELCQPPQCDTDEIACGRDCVNPRIELEFCGGCGGCPGTDNAEGIQCLEGQCTYRCLDGFVDVNSDINDPNGDGCECVPTGPEVCDGVDNDCDGLVDAMDDDVEPCTTEDGAEAACVAGACELACTPGLVDVNGDLGTGGNGCECEPNGDEVCDGQDNDCDGLVDTEDDDLEVGPEVCDGVDNDCNGQTDEGLLNACGECGPVPEEVCDGQDNDCDGYTDEEDGDLVATACGLFEGVCAQSLSACEDGVVLECSQDQYAQHAQDAGQVFEAGAETLCDEQDNNCDGQVDELCCNSDVRAFEVATTQNFFRIVETASNEDGTEVAILFFEGSGDPRTLKLLVLDIDGRPIHSIGDLGQVPLGEHAALHRDHIDETWVVTRTQGTRIIVATINDDGANRGFESVELGRDFRSVKTLDVGQSGFWLVGIDLEHALRVITIRGLEIGPQDVVLPTDFERGLRVDYVHFEADRNRAWFTFSVQEEDAGSGDSEHLVLRSTTIGGNPTISQEPILKFPGPNTPDGRGASSGGAVIKGHQFFGVTQQGADYQLIQRDLLDGENGQTTTLFAESDDAMALRDLVIMDDHIVLAVTIGRGTHTVRVINRGDNSFFGVSLVDYTDFEYSTSDVVEHAHGALFATSATTSQLASDLLISVFNQEADPLCPWQQ